MKTALTLFVLAIALPASAEWRIVGTPAAGTATWYVQGSTAEATEARDALLWQRDQHPLLGTLVTAALPVVSVTAVGGGVSEVAIVMQRPAADNWIADFAAAPGRCPGAVTQADTLACVDLAIKADLRQLIHRHRMQQREITSPVREPDIGRPAEPVGPGGGGGGSARGGGPQ